MATVSSILTYAGMPELHFMSKLKAELPRADAQRLAAVLLYARRTASAAYAEARRADAVARADRDAADYWSSVRAAVLAMISSSDASSPTLQ